MKLSEIKGVDAVETVANIIDPLTTILADEKIQKDIQTQKPVLLIVKDMLTAHKQQVLEFLAYLNMKDPKEFNPSIIELVKMLTEVLKDEEVIDLFRSQGQMMGDVSFGSVTESTEETETM